MKKMHIGAWEVTSKATLYDTDGGVKKLVCEETTQRYFRLEANAVQAMRPADKIRRVNDYAGPVEDE